MGTPSAALPGQGIVQYPEKCSKTLWVLITVGIHLKNKGGTDEQIASYWVRLLIYLFDGVLSDSEVRENCYKALFYLRDQLEDDKSQLSNFMVGKY